LTFGTSVEVEKEVEKNGKENACQKHEHPSSHYTLLIEFLKLLHIK
jgi:hypothetical protein